MRRSIFSLLLFIGLNAMSNPLDTSKVEHLYAKNDDVKLHYAAIGRKAAPLVVMIHGFPDYWYTWREQMSALEDSYRVAAIDLRGYNLSDQPTGVKHYEMSTLVGDIAAVIAAEGRNSSVVVGHDWGGAIAWNIAMSHPHLVDLLIILNLPHPQGMIRELRDNPAQKQASTYAFNFQNPTAHEYLSAEALARWVQDPEARTHYIEAFERSSFESMLNYYRANFPRPGERGGILPETVAKVKCPVLMFHGLDDTALLPGGLNDTWEWLESDLTLVTIPGADHFVQQARPKLINETMLDWLNRRVVRENQ